MAREKYRFIDLFAGIGGFRFAAESLGWQCVYSSEIDANARKAYAANFGHEPGGDISLVDARDIPDFDVLLAGFPCQPFSIIGKQRGFEDTTRGTLFFQIARILKEKRPTAFVLENVPQLTSNNGGKTFATILATLDKLGYDADWQVLNALGFNLPHNRRRVFIVGTRRANAVFEKGPWPKARKTFPALSKILETNPDPRHFVSAHIRDKRLNRHNPAVTPSIWHENKSGNISSHAFSCALRANASYNYLLVDGVRRLTPREALRLQGFPERFKVVCSDNATRRQAGNAVAVPVVKAVLKRLRPLGEDA